MQVRRVVALSRATLIPSRRNRHSIWILGITSCFDSGYHVLTIRENTFNHVKEKFIDIYFNDFVVRACVTQSRCDNFLKNLMCPCKEVTWAKHRVE